MKSLKPILAILFIIIGAYMFNIFRKTEASDVQNQIGSHLKSIDYDKVNWTEKIKDTEYWKKVQTPLQYTVTRDHGTERAFTGIYNEEKRKGVYHCSSCGQELFLSDNKFDSGTGWPSFFDVIKGNVDLTVDTAWGMKRTEVSCSRCKAHLGHVFEDGPAPTNLRYCMNSVSLIHSEDLKSK